MKRKKQLEKAIEEGDEDFVRYYEKDLEHFEREKEKKKAYLESE